eukprot:PhM_4_TR3280/c0_g1_i1/m.33692
MATLPSPQAAPRGGGGGYRRVGPYEIRDIIGGSQAPVTDASAALPAPAGGGTIPSSVANNDNTNNASSANLSIQAHVARSAVREGVVIDTNEPVAIKVRSKNLAATDPELAAETEDAIATFWRLPPHPNVCPYVETFVTAKNTYLVFGFKGYKTLVDVAAHQAIAEEKVDEASIAEIFRQVVAGVAHLHAHRLAHTALALEHCTFDTSGHVAIVSLDHIREVNEAGQMLCPRPRTVNPVYIPPEAHEATTASTYVDAYAYDVWSLGVVLYTLLHGFMPFTSWREVFQTDPPLRQHLSYDCKEIILGMLSADVKERLTLQQVMAHSWYGLMAHADDVHRNVTEGAGWWLLGQGPPDAEDFEDTISEWASEINPRRRAARETPRGKAANANNKNGAADVVPYLGVMGNAPLGNGAGTRSFVAQLADGMLQTIREQRGRELYLYQCTNPHRHQPHPPAPSNNHGNGNHPDDSGRFSGSGHGNQHNNDIRRVPSDQHLVYTYDRSNSPVVGMYRVASSRHVTGGGSNTSSPRLKPLHVPAPPPLLTGPMLDRHSSTRSMHSVASTPRAATPAMASSRRGGAAPFLPTVTLPSPLPTYTHDGKCAHCGAPKGWDMLLSDALARSQHSNSGYNSRRDDDDDAGGYPYPDAPVFTLPSVAAAGGTSKSARGPLKKWDPFTEAAEAAARRGSRRKSTVAPTERDGPIRSRRNSPYMLGN